LETYIVIISTLNPSTDDYEKSYLANPYTAGVTSIEVKNNNRFAANDRLQVGETGLEKTEVVTISSVNANGTTVVVGATVFDHEADAPVYQLRFDQVKIYRATSSTGTYTLLTTQNLDVDNADLATNYDDTTGTSAYYYKTSLYHSVSTLESSLSDAIAGTGYRRNQVGYIIDEVLQEVNDQAEQHVTRSEVLGYFNDVGDDLTINVAKPYDFLRARSALTRTAGRNYLDFPLDSNSDQTMWKFDRMDYNFTDSTTSPATDITYTVKIIPEEEFRNTYSDNTIDTTTEDDKIVVMTLDTAMQRFRYAPPSATTSSNVFYLYYWKYFDRISTEGQEIETPTAKIYKLYTKWRYYEKRSASEPSFRSLAQGYQAEYAQEKANYTKTNRRDSGTPRGFRPASSDFSNYRI
jgi:hypothetical protein